MVSTMTQLHDTSNTSCDPNSAEQLVEINRLQTQHAKLAMQRNAGDKIADIEKNLGDALWKAKLRERECSIRSPHPTKQAADNATEDGDGNTEFFMTWSRYCQHPDAATDAKECTHEFHPRPSTMTDNHRDLNLEKHLNNHCQQGQ